MFETFVLLWLGTNMPRDVRFNSLDLSGGIHSDDVREWRATELNSGPLPCLVGRTTGYSVPWQGTFDATTNKFWQEYQASKTPKRVESESNYVALVTELYTLAEETEPVDLMASRAKILKKLKGKLKAKNAVRIDMIRLELGELEADIEGMCENDRVRKMWRGLLK